MVNLLGHLYLPDNFFINRQNANLYTAFSCILESQDLLVSHDRAALFRPTKNVLFPDGTYKDMNHWRTGYNIHMDINPYTYMSDSLDMYNEKWSQLTYGHKLNNFINENNIAHKTTPHLQGVLNLYDNFEEDGGFVCVPGFTKHFNAWYNATIVTLSNIKTSPSISFSSKKHWLNKYAQRISMRAGSIVIWDSRLPHGSMPNQSSRMRCCQFVKMFLLSDIPNQEILLNRKETLKREIDIAKFNSDITPLGTKLFGLDETTKNNNQKTGQSTDDKNRKNNNEKNRIQGNKW